MARFLSERKAWSLLSPPKDPILNIVRLLYLRKSGSGAIIHGAPNV